MERRNSFGDALLGLLSVLLPVFAPKWTRQLRRLDRSLGAWAALTSLLFGSSGRNGVISRPNTLETVGQSRGETRLISLVVSVYGEKAHPHYSPWWLRSPKGGQMHIDVAVPDKRLAFEYQGEQHSEPVDHWGGGSAFIQQQQNDAAKRRLLAAHGWSLVEVWHDDPLTKQALGDKVRALKR